MKKAILLVNVGTPDSADVRDVRKYLSQFLNDPHVINIPWLWRKILVNCIIVPFRAYKSTALYRQLWTANGSPLRIHLENVRKLLQQRMNDRADIWAAMSYGQPNIVDVMTAMQRSDYQQITVIPLFPQYAMSTTGSVEDRIKKQIARWPVLPELTVIRQFYDEPLFLDAWRERIISYHLEHYDHIVFSFHGLPLSHLPRECRYGQYQDACQCAKQPDHPGIHITSGHCYRAACYDMAAKLASRIGLKDNQYTVAFQSRMSKYWLQPFTDRVLKSLALKGLKVLVVAPSFVADCLETIVELGIEYKTKFLKNGGQGYAWVESLNDQFEWIEALEMISEKK